MVWTGLQPWYNFLACHSGTAVYLLSIRTISTWKIKMALGKSRFAPQSTEELCGILNGFWKRNNSQIPQKPLKDVFCDKSVPQKRPQISSKRLQIPANARKTRNVVIFSAFLLDVLTRSVKIHTRAMWLCHQYAWLKGRILAWRCNGGTQETWRYMHSTWFSLIRHDFQQHAVNDMIFVWNDMKSWTPKKILSREDQGYNYSGQIIIFH